MSRRVQPYVNERADEHVLCPENHRRESQMDWGRKCPRWRVKAVERVHYNRNGLLPQEFRTANKTRSKLALKDNSKSNTDKYKEIWSNLTVVCRLWYLFTWHTSSGRYTYSHTLECSPALYIVPTLRFLQSRSLCRLCQSPSDETIKRSLLCTYTSMWKDHSHTHTTSPSLPQPVNFPGWKMPEYASKTVYFPVL